MSVASFQRTLDQELIALVRGVSLECLVCGEFVLHAKHAWRVRSAARCSPTASMCPRSRYHL